MFSLAVTVKVNKVKGMPRGSHLNPHTSPKGGLTCLSDRERSHDMW